MADLTPHAADGTLLSNVVAQIAAGVAGAGVVWRLLIAFGRQDRAAAMEAELREELRQQNAKLDADLDRIAHERNEAVQVRGQLETELRVAKEDLATAKEERDEARAALVRIQAENERLLATNHRLTEEAAVADARCPAGAGPTSRQVPGERPWR